MHSSRALWQHAHFECVMQDEHHRDHACKAHEERIPQLRDQSRIQKNAGHPGNVISIQSGVDEGNDRRISAHAQDTRQKEQHQARQPDHAEDDLIRGS